MTPSGIFGDAVSIWHVKILRLDCLDVNSAPLSHLVPVPFHPNYLVSPMEES